MERTAHITSQRVCYTTAGVFGRIQLRTSGNLVWVVEWEKPEPTPTGQVWGLCLFETYYFGTKASQVPLSHSPELVWRLWRHRQRYRRTFEERESLPQPIFEAFEDLVTAFAMLSEDSRWWGASL